MWCWMFHHVILLPREFPHRDNKIVYLSLGNIPCWGCTSGGVFVYCFGAMVACWLERRTPDLIERLRVRILAGVAGELSSPKSTLCADSYSVSVPPPMLPQWHVKDSGHSAKSAGGRLHLNTYTPLTHRSWSGLTKQCGNLSENKLACNSSGTLSLSSLSSLSHSG